MPTHLPNPHRTFLRSVLGFRPLLEPLCRLARQVLPQDEPLTAATEEMRRAANEAPAHQGAYEAAREQLAMALLAADTHGLFTDLVVADLIGIEGGQRDGLNMLVEPPPRNLSFLLYVSTVRRNHLALWAEAS